MTATTALRALDLFAGTGWGVACQRLGIDEMGVEIMPEAIATRTANGMHTIYHDVWDGLTGPRLSYDILIASPPCQTFSLAGKGAGRAALDDVIEAIQLHAYKDPAALKAFGEKHDPRTALVLTPLAHVWRDHPRFVTMEQVPTVLPVWEACAEIMRGLGYSVKVANLQAEQYGVPQTRKRAILVARLDGDVQLPAPTHSRYYSTNPTKLDPGVKKWVSMAEALGWRGLTTRPSPTVTGGGTDAGGAEPIAKFHERYTGAPGWIGETNRLTPDEAAALQSYPTAATKPQTAGRTANYGPRPDRPSDAPAFTVVGHDGHPRGGFEWRNEDGTTRRLTTDELAALQSYPAVLRPEVEDWKWKDAPATTVAGDPRITAREHHFHGQQSKTSLRLTFPEATALQTYPKPFVWCGTKTKQFLQIGNAVPPLLAEAILSALTATEFDIEALIAEELVSA